MLKWNRNSLLCIMNALVSSIFGPENGTLVHAASQIVAITSGVEILEVTGLESVKGCGRQEDIASVTSELAVERSKTGSGAKSS